MRGSFYEHLWRFRASWSTHGVAPILDELNQSQYWSTEALRHLRERKLRNLVTHAYEQIPLYRRLLDERGVHPTDISGLDDLPKLPVLTKQTFRDHWRDLRALDFPDGRVGFANTGGTTGVPMRIARDAPSAATSIACYIRGLEWGGLTIRDRRVKLVGGTLGIEPLRRFDWLRSWLSGKIALPAFELGPQNLDSYIKKIRYSQARFLIGYASACYSLAVLVERAGESLTFDAVFPTAELCLPKWQEKIVRVFSAKVLPYYGCGEVNSLGYTCPNGGIYHVCDEHAVIEVEDGAGRANLEGEGAFLITDLDNYAMPLIRYRNGDAGQLAPAGCACGRTLGRILRLDGRINDMLVTTTGARISGVIATHAFRLIKHVEAYQIVQSAPGQATIRIVRGARYDPAVEEAKIYSIFHKHLGMDSQIAIEYVSSIAKTPAGKARFVINEHLTA